MVKEIRNEILNLVNKNDQVDSFLLDKINVELDVLECTEGLDGKSNLEGFYDILKDSKGKVGTKNRINSWVAWAVGLTNEKPNSDEFLPSKRVFARPGFPDIDSDFDFFRRDEIYKYIIDKYGRENVENIGTYIGLKLRMALTRTIKALDIAQSWHKGKQEFVTENMAKVDEILSQLPKPKGAFMKAKDEEGKEQSIKTIEQAIKYCPDFKYYMDKYPAIVKHTKNIQGLLSSFSKHPAGIVISDVPVHTLSPVRRSKKDQFASQYDMNDLESMGLIKLDILATSILTVIDRTVKMVKDNYNIDIDVENLKLEDEKTFALYRSGNLKGVFQCENRGMQQTMRDIGVTSFDDIVAAIALYRPGPMGSIPDYCERKKGLSPVSYFHPTIEPFVKPYLEKTYGILTYQEHVMQICNSLAGISVTDGYILIKGIGKKKEHLISQYKKQFISGCVKNKVPADIAEQYWDTFIIPFASYGFNKCIDGSMRIKDKNTNEFCTIEEMEKRFRDNKNISVVLDSYKDGEIVRDELIDVFETGEKDVYEVELDSGIVLKCTLDHKFICSDGKKHTIQEILDDSLEMILGVNTK